MVVRFFMQQAHYRSTLDFSNEALKASEKGFERLMQAIEKVGLALPIVVRLEGTNAKEGLDILNASNFNIITEADLTRAAKQVVEMAK